MPAYDIRYGLTDVSPELTHEFLSLNYDQAVAGLRGSSLVQDGRVLLDVDRLPHAPQRSLSRQKRWVATPFSERGDREASQ